jgi:hypothetical protein
MNIEARTAAAMTPSKMRRMKGSGKDEGPVWPLASSN